MLSNLYSYFYPEVEVKVDEKQLRQKYLVLLQIRGHKIRLKPISRGSDQKKIPPHKRPLWKKMPVIL